MSRSGQRKARRNASFIETVHKKISPHNYLENKLLTFEKMDDDARLLWADFQKYLADEREKVLNEIAGALIENVVSGYEENCFSRIVGSKFSRMPLSSKGSYIAPPGGRFNIGQSISYHSYFPALYVADTFETAYLEKFQTPSNNPNGLDLALRKPDSFTHQRVKFKLDKIIDLNSNNAIEAFFEIVRDIKMPKMYKQQAKKLNIGIEVTPNATRLRESIFDLNFQQWDYWIDQPSPSQWFGHYVRYAGIQGIKYPSVRTHNGQNIAIFLDQFDESQSSIELIDECDFVSSEQRKVDNSNFKIFI